MYIFYTFNYVCTLKQIMAAHLMEQSGLLVVNITWAERKYVKMNNTLVSVVTASQDSMQSSFACSWDSLDSIDIPLDLHNAVLVV